MLAAIQTVGWLGVLLVVLVILGIVYLIRRI